MKKDYSLSDTETRIMELLWQLREPLSLKELTAYLNEQLDKDWKQQTVGTYLAHLIQAGLVYADKRFARSYLYFPACTREEYRNQYVQKLLEESFDNSVVSLVRVLMAGKKISRQELEELKSLLAAYEKEKVYKS